MRHLVISAAFAADHAAVDEKDETATRIAIAETAAHWTLIRINPTRTTSTRPAP
jgi:hypothetical protein